MIYRLPCRAVLSVRKSLRAVRIAERNSYIENTPLGTPSGTAGEWKRLFFWLQKSGVNCEKRKRFTLSPIQPLSLFAPSEQKSSSPCTGEPRNAPQTLGGNPVQGSRKARRKRYILSGDTTPQSKPTVLPAPLAQGSRETLRKPSVRALHRGAEVRSPSVGAGLAEGAGSARRLAWRRKRLRPALGRGCIEKRHIFEKKQSPFRSFCSEKGLIA